MAARPETWGFSQCFGDKADADELTDADIVTVVQFNETGEYLATGDKGGRIVVFRWEDGLGGGDAKGATKVGSAAEGRYTFHVDFQSHEPEFDYLKSLEIEEKINKIKWCRGNSKSLFLLSTNDKTIKLWKLFEKRATTVSQLNLEDQGMGAGSVPRPRAMASDTLRVPRLDCGTLTTPSAACRRTFPHAHAYHINSISLNSDHQTFLSADDLRINMWNLDIPSLSYNIVDIKPDNMEELTEVITAAEFHPSSCNLFVYSSSRGSVKLSDMRERAICDRHSKLFEEAEDPASKSFFSEIIASISDVKFTPNGRFFVTRDYLQLKVWDLNMESRPVLTIDVHEHLHAKLCDLYENDCIFDKFECSVASGSAAFVTGSYGNVLHMYDRFGERQCSINATVGQAGVIQDSGSSAGGARGGAAAAAGMGAKKNRSVLAGRGGGGGASAIDPSTIDFSKKILHIGWHPRLPLIAVAGLNNLFTFCATDRP